MNSYELGSTNVYADLGYKDAAEMLVKAQLVAKISQIIKARRWTQQEAAAVLSLPQPKLSKILRGEFRNVSEARLRDWLARLDDFNRVNAFALLEAPP